MKCSRKRLLVPIPPPGEQGAIAEVLDGVDAAIADCRTLSWRAETLRNAVLEDVLIRGLGANGTLRDRASMEEFVDTEIGRLPRAWRMSRVGSEFTLQTGFTLNPDRIPRHRPRPYLRVANVQRDALSLGDIQRLEATDTEFALRTLAIDDLLVVEGHADRRQIGRCARVCAQAAGMTFQNHLFRLRTRGDIVPAFAALWLNGLHAQRFWNARCGTSSGLNTINQRDLKRLPIPIPNEREQRAIAELVRAHTEYESTLTSQEDALRYLKSALMSALFAGKRRVELVPTTTEAVHA